MQTCSGLTSNVTDACRRPEMSADDRRFQCFSAAGDGGSHEASAPFKHHTTRLPRIPRHGMVAHRGPPEECYVCSEHRRVRAMEEFETQVPPLCHAHAPHHHHRPRQHVSRGPARPEEAHPGHGRHAHHHRYSKKVMLVKNGDPSCRKAIVLHRRSLRSFGLFLEEVSELMQYHIRKLYTLEGRKVDSVQTLMQCPRVLVCVGREPFHPSIVENFRKTSHDKLPKLTVKSHSSEGAEGHQVLVENQGLPTKKSLINPKLESGRKSNRQSVSSDKSLTDGTDSPDMVDSCPPSGEAVRDEDIEKRVRVNKDGSLSMEMKVRFRLQNDETIHWSTEVRKTTGRACEYPQEHKNPCYVHVGDRSLSESENISTGEQGEEYVTKPYHRHPEEPHCPRCCSHCHEYDIWKNTPGIHGASRCIQTSSSSASSHTRVSRKMVVERKTMSRSSEEHVEQVLEAETVEYCTIRSETLSPKYNTQDICDAVDNSPDNQFNVQTSDQREHAQSANLYDDGSPTATESNVSEQFSKSRKTKTLHACHCRVSDNPQDDVKRQFKDHTGREGEVQKDRSSAMSVKSNASVRSNQIKDTGDTQCEDVEENRTKSAMSVHSNASAKSKNDLDGMAEEITQGDKDTQERPLSSTSVRSSRSKKSVRSEVTREQSKSALDDHEERALSSMSSKSKASNKSKVSFLLNEEQTQEEREQRTSSAMSARSHTSAASAEEIFHNPDEESENETGQKEKKSERSAPSPGSLKSEDTNESLGEEDEVRQNQDDRARVPSVVSSKSNTSAKSTHSKASRCQNEENAKEDTEERSTSVLSAKSAKSKSSEIDVELSAKEVQDPTSRTPSALSGVSSNKADSDKEIVEIEERAPSTMSVKSAQSHASTRSKNSKTSKILSNENQHSAGSTVSEKFNASQQSIVSDISAQEKQAGNKEHERASSALSDRSTKSNVSATSKKQSDFQVRESVESVDDGNAEEKCEGRPQSKLSVKSAKSTKSNISVKSSKTSNKESHDDYEDVIQQTDESAASCDDETEEKTSSIKNEEIDKRSQSCTSHKSAKSNISARSSKSQPDQGPAGENNSENEEERLSSALSLKSAHTNISAKSNMSKPSDADLVEHRERAQSNMSTTSTKSAKSATSMELRGSESPSKNCGDMAEEITLDGETEGRSVSSMSVQSVRSSTSAKSNKSKCSAHDAAEEIHDFNEQSEKRAASSISAKSQVSTISIKSAGKAPSVMSAKSAKSHASTKSIKSVASQGHSVITTRIHDDCDVGEEIQDRAQSAVSAKSASTNVSARSRKSKCSAGVPAEESCKTSDEEEGKRQTEERAASSMSAKSMQSSVSEISIKSAERAPSAFSPRSANSRASAKSIKSIVSEIVSSKSDVIHDEGDDGQESEDRVQSAKSVISASTPSKGPDEDTTSDHEQKEDSISSNVSVRSAKSVKSNVSARSTKSTTSDIPPVNLTCGDNSEKEEEHNKSRAGSSKSVRSVKSNVSVTSETSKCSADVPVGESIDRPNSHVSTQSMKSPASNAPPDACTPDGTNDEEETEDRAESAISAKSSTSANSKKSKALAASAGENKERPSSTTSKRSVQSVKSNVSEPSQKSKASNIVSEHSTEIADTENKGRMSPVSSQSNISSTSKKSKCCHTPTEQSSDIKGQEETEQSEGRVASGLSFRSGQSHVSERSTKSQTSVEGNGEKENIVRPPSTLTAKSVRSAKSTQSSKSGQSHATGVSKKSKSSEVPAENSANITGTEGDTEKRAVSSASVRSVKSNVTDETQTEEAEQPEGSTSGLSNISARTVKSSVSGMTPGECTEHHHKTSKRTRSVMSAKSGKSNMSEIPARECSDSTSEANAEERTSRAMSEKSVISVRSDVTRDENVSEKDGRRLSPVSAKSEVPSVTVEKTEERAPTVMSSKSKASARSKKSTPNIEAKKNDVRTPSSLSVKSDPSVKSQKSNISTNEPVGNTVEFEISDVANPQGKNSPTCDLQEEDERHDPADRRSCRSETSRQGTQNAAGSSAEAKSAAHSRHGGDKHNLICHTKSNESYLSQTLSSSDVVKEMCEIPATRESESTEAKGITNGPLESTDLSKSVPDNKGDKSSSNNVDASDFELVTSSLPNASPTEVVNEWLKTIPADGDMYNMEELNENCEAEKNHPAVEETDEAQLDNDSPAENTKDGNEGVSTSGVPDGDANAEAANEENYKDASKIFHSSVQVMKVLLNPKLDRCNSLPEVSPVYGRKLSTSAKGLLDCLVKLQLIDNDPKNANEKGEKYQELMKILQSLWLCDPPEKEQVNLRHSVDDEFNHTSSSGVDVNSGSTGSGKSSDGVKSSDGANCDASQPHASANILRKIQEVCEEEGEKDQWTCEREEEAIHQEKPKEDDPATDDTIRSNDSPRELPETPPTSNKSSENDRDAQQGPGEAEHQENPTVVHRAQLTTRISQDPDPVWVLTLLTKLENQFMAHYINAMREFKARWNLDDNKQLDLMISELEADVHKRIQMSVNRELRKIRGRAGQPRPPEKTMSRASTAQTEGRRRRLKIMLKQSADPQAEKSDDSATGTSYSDQRSENDDEYCPCESCVRRKTPARQPLPADALKCAPVVMDFDLKSILVTRSRDPDHAQAANESETTEAATLVKTAIVKAVTQVEGNEIQHDAEDAGQEDGLENSEGEASESEWKVENTGTATDSAEKEGSEEHTEDPSADTMGEMLEEQAAGSNTGENAKDKDKEDDVVDERAVEDTDQEEIEEERESEAKEVSAAEDENAAKDEAEAAKGDEKSDRDVIGDGAEAEEEAVAAFTDEDETDADADASDYEEEMAVTSEEEKKEEAADATTAESASQLVESHEEEDEEQGAINTGEALPSTCSEEPAEDIDDTTTAQDSSVEPAEEATTEDEVVDKKELVEDASKEDTAEEESTEEKIAATSENESGSEEAVEVGMADGDEASAASEDGSAEDETAEEKCATGDEEPISEDEHVLEKETHITSEELKEAADKHTNENAEGTDYSEDESACDINGTATSGDASKEPAEEEDTEDGMGAESEDDLEEDIAEGGVTAGNTSVAATSENESDKEEGDNKESADISGNGFAKDAVTTEDETAEESDASAITEHNRDAGQGMDVISDDESNKVTKAGNANAPEESDVAKTEDESDRDEADDDDDDDDDEAQSTATNDEGETAEENDAVNKAAEVATSEHDTATEKDNATSEDESKKERTDAEDDAVMTEDETDADEAAEAQENDDGGQTAATNDEGTTSNDATTEHESDAAAEEEIPATSVNKSESDREEAAKKETSEDESDEEKKLAATSEDEIKEETEKEEHADVEETAASSDEDDGAEDLGVATDDNETAEKNDNTDVMAIGRELDTTGEEDTKEETEEGNSGEEEISETVGSNEEEVEETTGGEEPVEEHNSAAADPKCAGEESSKDATEREAEEDGIVNNTTTDINETTGEEDTSKVTSDNESEDDHSHTKRENNTGHETAEADKVATLESERSSVEEPSEKNPESSATEDKDKDAEKLRDETTGDESEEVENVCGRESGARGEDITEDGTMTQQEVEGHETAPEESGEATRAGNEISESDGGDESNGDEEESAVEEIEESQTGRDESTEDESARDTDDRQQHSAGEDEDVLEESVCDSENNPGEAKQTCEESEAAEEHQEMTNDDVVELRPDEDVEVQDISEEDEKKGEDCDGHTETSVTQCEHINIPGGSHDTDKADGVEKEEEGIEAQDEACSRFQGDSADGEDEAEEDSDEEDDGEKDFVPSKRDKLEAANRAAEETALIPLDALINVESEDGAYADVEDSETELNSQEDVTSLERKGFEKRTPT